ncbi:hypothetical protein Nepgr_001251 [Nepenthes gracilis]|uniref:Uncharacterized protein n=1 Tax=Nepenthes gracilis TaxID=150966 RepID=A0AAD3P4Y4_NEPGR|nr:hypothetical protein Nepgr_001251 [Nepenthes gracilis]
MLLAVTPIRHREDEDPRRQLTVAASGFLLGVDLRRPELALSLLSRVLNCTMLLAANQNNSNNRDHQATSDKWRLSRENDNLDHSIFGKDDGVITDIAVSNADRELKLMIHCALWGVVTVEWVIFERDDMEFGESGGAGDGLTNDSEWATAARCKPWSLEKRRRWRIYLILRSSGSDRDWPCC